MNHILQRLRQQLDDPLLVKTPSGMKPTDRADTNGPVGAMELRRLYAPLSELHPLCRDAFLLNRIEDLTHAEIAARLGVSVRTIDRHMVKAWEHLRRHFGRGCTR